MKAYQNFPFAECAEAADQLVRSGCDVFQKWSCEHCLTRQTMPDANHFYMRGLCEECGKETDIVKTGCNYMVVASGAVAVDYLLGEADRLDREGEDKC